MRRKALQILLEAILLCNVLLSLWSPSYRWLSSLAPVRGVHWEAPWLVASTVIILGILAVLLAEERSERRGTVGISVRLGIDALLSVLWCLGFLYYFIRYASTPF
jgi:hypothetical protein